MKKLTMFMLALSLFASCAHKHHCSHCSEAKTECASCKETDASKTADCPCSKK